MAKATAKSGMKNKPRDDEDDDVVDADDEDEAPKAKKKAKPAADDDDDDDDDAPKAKSKTTKKAAASDDDEDGEGDDEVLNLEEVDENSSMVGEIVPAGRYKCEVLETEFVTFKTGSKGLKIRLAVSEGEFAKSKKRPNAVNFFTNLVMSQKAAPMFKAGLKALGVSKKVYGSSSFTVGMLRKLADSGDLIGNEVSVMVKIGTYEGNKKNEVRRMSLPTDDVAEGDDGFDD